MNDGDSVEAFGLNVSGGLFERLKQVATPTIPEVNKLAIFPNKHPMGHE